MTSTTQNNRRLHGDSPTRRRAGVLALGVTLMVVSACAGDYDTTSRAGGDDTDRTAAGRPGSGHADLSDANIVSLLALANRSDIEGGQLAQQKATNTSVRDYGRRMISDHTALLDRGSRWSQQTMTNPVQPDRGQDLVRDHQQAMERLKGKSGQEFDRAYIDHEIEMHQKIIRLVNQAEGAADEPRLRRLLQESKPVLEDHLQEARTIRQQL